MGQLQLHLNSGRAIPYQLERRTRNTIGLKISPQGLVVLAPRRLSMAQLEAALLSKAGWIEKKLDHIQAQVLPGMVWQDGTQLWLLGQEMRLQVEPHSQNKMLKHLPGQLLLATSTPDNQEYLAHKVVQWYRSYAKQDFARRLALFAARLGERLPAMALSNAKTRWGSCNSKREIRLNWRLIQAPPHIINYVICHELAHLREMNHSSRFWAIVASICPDYQQAEADLKLWSVRLHAVDSIEAA